MSYLQLRNAIVTHKNYISCKLAKNENPDTYGSLPNPDRTICITYRDDTTIDKPIVRTQTFVCETPEEAEKIRRQIIKDINTDIYNVNGKMINIRTPAARRRYMKTFEGL